MGNNRSKERQKCFEELKFILKSFQIKYREYDRIPKYGLETTINELNDNHYNNWIFIEEFLRNLKRWRIDMNFIMSMEKLHFSDNKETVIYNSFIGDTFSIEDKIKEIVEKYQFSNKLKTF